jgi:predicted GH43/DUF377 family glycosyl hydrolase
VLSPSARADEVVTRTDVRLLPDLSRVLARLFVPGEELPSNVSRLSPLMQRVLAVDEDQAEALVADILDRFKGHQPDLYSDLLDHFEQIAGRLGTQPELSEAQRLLLGAYFTADYSVEGAALCNPSMVPHPDQGGLAPGETRFVLSLRGIGEGHISSIQFRSGVIGADCRIRLDPTSGHLHEGKVRTSLYSKEHVAAQLAAAGVGNNEIAELIVDSLPDSFTDSELETGVGSIHSQLLARQAAQETIESLRLITAADYTVDFPHDSRLDERILFPYGPTEKRGMEDARFVRFTNDSGVASYYATYTAFDGAHIAPQMLHTIDFTSFEVSQLSGPAATNKGMALFPRKIAGRYAALSRWDRERIALTTSSDAWYWDLPVTIQTPEQPWESVQLGNCGSPIETPEGWLVITHAVGPMRTYTLGAILLDLDQPTQIRAKLSTPLMVPEGSERQGYVPNVLYSCGSMLRGDKIVLPYSWSDYATTIALIDLPGLLDCMLRP